MLSIILTVAGFIIAIVIFRVQSKKRKLSIEIKQLVEPFSRSPNIHFSNDSGDLSISFTSVLENRSKSPINIKYKYLIIPKFLIPEKISMLFNVIQHEKTLLITDKKFDGIKIEPGENREEHITSGYELKTLLENDDRTGIYRICLLLIDENDNNYYSNIIEIDVSVICRDKGLFLVGSIPRY